MATLSLPEKVTPPVKASAAAVVGQPETVYVRSVHGRLLHLYTNVWFTQDPKKVELDDFLKAQVDAGKLEIVPA